MKKKFVNINAFLIVVVLSSILFQAVHNIEHLTTQLFEKKCVHKHNSRAEITHLHHNFNHCTVCEVKISNYILSDFISFQFQFSHDEIQYQNNLQESFTPIYVIDSLLRGPPNFIV